MPDPLLEQQPLAVCNEELVTVQDARRRMNELVEALERGEVEKFVLMRGACMVAVLTSLPLVGGEWQCCPVCRGVCTVPPGFYSHAVEGATSAYLVREPCRACAGRGMVLRPWNPVSP